MLTRLPLVVYFLFVSTASVNSYPVILLYVPYTNGPELFALANPAMAIKNSFFVLTDELIYQVEYVRDDLKHAVPAAVLGSIENRYELLKRRLLGKVTREFPIFSIKETWLVAERMRRLGLPPIAIPPWVIDQNPLARPTYEHQPAPTSQTGTGATHGTFQMYLDLVSLIVATIRSRIVPLYSDFTQCVESKGYPGGLLDQIINLDKCRDGFLTVLNVISLFQSRMAQIGLLSPSDHQMFDAWKSYLNEAMVQPISGTHYH